jgi:hypothetical protein
MFTDKQYEAEKKRVHRLVVRWTRTFGLQHWRITDEWRRERFKNKHIVASVKVKWEYQEAVIEWCLPKSADLTNERLEEVVIHELVHILVAELVDQKSEKNEERVVVNLANAFIWTKEKYSRRKKK